MSASDPGSSSPFVAGDSAAVVSPPQTSLQPDAAAGPDVYRRELKANRKIAEESACARCSQRFEIAEGIVQCGSCGGYEHVACWDESGACVREECRQGLKPCPACRKFIKQTALKCRHCRQYVDSTIKQALYTQDPGLRNYIYNTEGIGRVELNVLCGIGSLICGWLIIAVFGKLGKSGIGWGYVVPAVTLFIIGMSQQSDMGAFCVLLYLAAWVHANLVLSGYQAAARRRLILLEDRAGHDINAGLEKGVLLTKVLGDKVQGLTILRQAMTVPGGDWALRNIATTLLSKG